VSSSCRCRCIAVFFFAPAEYVDLPFRGLSAPLSSGSPGGFLRFSLWVLKVEGKEGSRLSVGCLSSPPNRLSYVRAFISVPSLSPEFSSLVGLTVPFHISEVVYFRFRSFLWCLFAGRDPPLEQPFWFFLLMLGIFPFTCGATPSVSSD